MSKLIVDAQQAYREIVEYGTYENSGLQGSQKSDVSVGSKRIWYTLWMKKKQKYITNAEAALWFLNEQEQYEMDVAMWYGTLENSSSLKKEVIKRVLTTLYYGGLMYKRNGVWQKWSESDVPIVSSISHGGRVVIQLPAGNNGFWRWLWADMEPEGRKGATHGLSYVKVPIDIGGRRKYVKEDKLSTLGGFFSSNHFGINIGVGGVGNINPFSGVTIQEDGCHGHLYIKYLQPSATGCGAVMIGCEGSAPLDRYDGPGTFASDQTGHKHTFGASGKFSPTGGKKWKEREWHNDGPDSSEDAMFIDLVATGWRFLKAKIGGFRSDKIGKTGRAPDSNPILRRIPRWQGYLPSAHEWNTATKAAGLQKQFTVLGHLGSESAKAIQAIGVLLGQIEANPTGRNVDLARQILGHLEHWIVRKSNKYLRGHFNAQTEITTDQVISLLGGYHKLHNEGGQMIVDLIVAMVIMVNET